MCEFLGDGTTYKNNYEVLIGLPGSHFVHFS